MHARSILIAVGVAALAFAGGSWWESSRRMLEAPVAAATSDVPSVSASAGKARSPASGIARHIPGQLRPDGRMTGMPDPRNASTGLASGASGSRDQRLLNPMSDEAEQLVAEQVVDNDQVTSYEAQAAEWRRRFEHEPRDDDWAPRMENALAVALAERAGMLYSLQVARPICGSTLCMLSAVGPDGPAANGPGAQWGDAVSIISNQPWWQANFQNMNGQLVQRGEHFVYLNYLERRR